MFDTLFENRVWVYLALAIPAVILFTLWYRSGKRGFLYAVGVVALLAAVFFLLDLTIETRLKQIRRKLQEMAQGVKKKDADAIFRHVSDDFDFEGLTKAQFKAVVEALLKNGTVTDLVVWDEKFPDGDGNVVFMAKPRSPMLKDEAMFRVRAQFVRDRDGQWRLKSFTVHNPINNERWQLREHLPGPLKPLLPG